DKVKFFDLGLVIIDEEHKFGVKQKEKIRLKYRINNFSQNIDEVLPDVLSLTATPIPRTLAFGLEGIKDISLIETPPEGRVPIETFVLPYNEEIVISAINRELIRDGQVYYVFNDISLIQSKVNHIKKFFPNIEIEFIHSKLPAKKIEEVMIRFINKEIKILITTSIIESGLDIPSVNTIIIENVEKFGLAQLYQLRGRVGRRSVKAYCYFLYSNNMTLNAKKRISALLEFSSLGSGYKLALRDLEIRGAGEVLGTKQHGFVNDIGLSMYSKIIQELISEIKTAVDYQRISPKIELDIETYIPDEYILNSEIKVVFYRKLLQAENIATIESIKEEMEDRFGKISKYEQLKNLFLLCKLRIYLKKYKIAKLYYEKEKTIKLFFKFLDSQSKQNLFSLWKNNFYNIKIYQEKENVLIVETKEFSLKKILYMFQI
ncbi:MAG: helicase-related protein, partial [Endomicrobiia bacterium]